MSFIAGLAEAGHEVEIADLHAEGFDPRMSEADEPDWNDPDKRYSAAVLEPSRRASPAMTCWPSSFRSGGGRYPPC